jgi:hypothetical protein
MTVKLREGNGIEDSENRIIPPFKLNLQGCRDWIPILGKQDPLNPKACITPIIQSEPGCGKSSLLEMLEEDLGDSYDYIYLDCPIMDYSDICMKIPNKETKCLEPYIGSVFKMDSPKPKVIMLDEIMKAPKMTQTMFMKLLLERKIDDVPLPEGSIIFGTSNNITDGVGDGFLAHGGNRVCIIELLKVTPKEWCEWATRNDIHPYIQALVTRYPDLLASYRDDGFDPKLNPCIFDPSNPQLSFSSPRSLAKLDVVVRNRDKFSHNDVMTIMAGIVGKATASQFSALMAIGDKLPSWEEIMENPEKVPVDERESALMILMFQAVNKVETSEDITQFLKFVDRIEKNEIQTIFYTMAVNASKPEVRSLCVAHKKFGQWCRENKHNFEGDNV